MTMQISGSSGVTFPNTSTQTGGADLINNTGAGSDLTLQMGQTAYVGFSGATSIPLRIATQNNQIYEIKLVNSSAAATNLMYLNPNNSSSWTMQVFQQYVTSGSGVGQNFITETAGFRFCVGGSPLMVSAKVFTWTSRKTALIQGRDTNIGTGYGYHMEIDMADITSAYTSLGTLVCATALTGTVWVTRIG